MTALIVHALCYQPDLASPEAGTIRYDKDRYCGRHLIENAFCRLKDFRRVATVSVRRLPSEAGCGCRLVANVQAV